MVLAQSSGSAGRVDRDSAETAAVGRRRCHRSLAVTRFAVGRQGRRARDRGPPNGTDPLGDDRGDLAARRLQPAAHGARQWLATDLRAQAGPGSCRARALRRRRALARGEARSRLPDRPFTGRGNVDSYRARAGRSDRRRGGHTREQRDGKLDSRLPRGPGPGGRAPRRRDDSAGLPRGSPELGCRAHRRRLECRPRRSGLPRRAELPKHGLRNPSAGPRPAGRRP